VGDELQGTPRLKERIEWEQELNSNLRHNGRREWGGINVSSSHQYRLVRALRRARLFPLLIEFAVTNLLAAAEFSISHRQLALCWCQAFGRRL
jgi:hypothetical protein